jgi:hypothetical protein
MQQLRDLLGFDLAELRGARVSGEVPLTDSLLNRVIAEQLRAKGGPVSALVVEPLDGDALNVHVRMHTAFVPTLKVHLRVEAQPTFPDSPALVLRWSLGALGALARMASPVLALLKVLPPGVRVDGDLVGVDVAELLRARGLGELLPWIAKLRVTTQSGRVIVAFDVRHRA